MSDLIEHDCKDEHMDSFCHICVGRMEKENERLTEQLLGVDSVHLEAKIKRLTARLEKEYERGDKSAQDAVNAQLDVNRLQARVEELERSIEIRDDGARRQKAKVEALEADCVHLMRIAAEAYDSDDLGMTFGDWMDMNGYRLGAATEQENKCAFCGSSEYPHICEGWVDAFRAATEQETGDE